MSAALENPRPALFGEKLVRLFYIDESGRSDLTRDPHFIVAGIGIHGDTQYKAIVSYIAELKRFCFPLGAPQGFFFHATELYSGGKFFDRENWPWSKRAEILNLLAQIPSLFNLPVFVSSLDRKEFRNSVGPGDYTEQHFMAVEHSICLAHCEVAMDQWLIKAAPDELAMLFAEDVKEVKTSLKAVHSCLLHELAKFDPRFEPIRGMMPLSRIVDTLNFAEKKESPLLQIADLCTFLAKRNLLKDNRISEAFEFLSPMIADWSQWRPF